MDPLSFRLPTDVLPLRYDVHLQARVASPTFSGTLRIALDVKAPTSRLILHSRELTVSEVKVHQGSQSIAGRAEPDAAREIVVITLETPVSRGEAALELCFDGHVSRSMEGLYLSEEGDERCLATQCEETDARAIFPCFDEPAFKAQLHWTVTTARGDTVLTNGALVDTRIEDDGSRTWEFAATPPMSTYLAAVCIGKVASTEEPRVARDVPLRVWAMRGKEELGRYALDISEKLLPWFEDYFGARYHFGKYDQIAVPSFSAGAMENSGLVIFRKSLLLHDPATTSWRGEKTIARVIAHEMAHQWFGNLVTMQWWDDIWLNESFAEWVAHKAVDAVAPHYRVWDDFQDGTSRALRSDALQSTHPVYAPVETPAQATEMFDAITYEKGSSTLRMIEAFLGEDAFRKGLRTYMREFAEKNACGDDLWRHLEQASSKPVRDIMGSWLLQPGHPVVRIEADAPRDGLARVRLAQRRFALSPDAPATEATWRIPLILRHADDAGSHETRVLLDAAKGEVRLAVAGNLRWLQANAHGLGFYRCDPDDALLGSLIENLDALTAAEQATLLDDQWGLVRNATREPDAYVRLLSATLTRATHPSVLERAVDHLFGIEDFLTLQGDDDVLEAFRAWTRKRLETQHAALGLVAREGDTRDDRQRRAHLLRALAHLGHDPRAIAAARALADHESEDPARVDADLAGPALAIAARFGDAQTLEHHLHTYLTRRASGASPEAAQRHLMSLAYVTGEAQQARVRQLLHDGTLPLEAFGPLMRAMFSIPHARQSAWTHLRSDWRTVRERVGDMWTGFLVEASGQLPHGLRDDLVAFYDANLHGVAQQAYGRALETMRERASFLERTGAALGEAFGR